ncbi:hypothetical protein B0H14DRAFT_2794300 [Mycena olivaceomarginata]|nr:hypothetical protein B0H14DRAFT_2794300 [Mycena olivaceomarginata]
MSRPQNPEYASPVIRDPSPASSVGTVYGPDQTPSSDEELDQAAFERKWDYEVAGALHLHKLTAEEEAANKDPLIARPSTAAEERHLFEKTLLNLRTKVEELEDSELFEQTMLRGSTAAMEEETIPKDIDALMLSMMPGGPALHSTSKSTLPADSTADATVTDGPVAGTAQRRGKGKGRSRK